MPEEVKGSVPREDESKRTKHRSPNYPAISLRKAVERLKQLHDKYKRSPVPVNLAHELWEYKPHGSSGNQCVAALKAYGLIDVEGDGQGRRVRVSDAGFRIALNSPDRAVLLKQAAVMPAIHEELFNKYSGGDFPVELIRHFLTFDRPDGTFNPEVVDGFIDSFRDTLQFSELLGDGIVEHSDGLDIAKTNMIRAVKPGDYVQWTANGTDMFDPPQQVLGIDDSGAFAFVATTGTGLPVEQLTVVKPPPLVQPSQGGGAKMPPVNPFVVPKAASDSAPPQGAKEDTYDLSEGRAVFRWPEKLDQESVDELEDWFALLVRKMRRTNKYPPAPTKDDKGQI